MATTTKPSHAPGRQDTIGIDLGDRVSTICVLDADGEVIDTGTVRMTADAFTRRFAREAPARIVLEASSQSPWTSRLLSSLGHEVVVANPHRVRLIGESQRKDDRTDAETLARLGRIDPQLLGPITHRSEQLQRDMAVLRSREAILSCRTQLINHARGIAKATLGHRLPSCGASTFHHRALAAMPPELALSLNPVLVAVGGLTQTLRTLEREIDRIIRERYPEATALQQVVGVGPLTSLAFVLTIGDPNRFRSSRSVGAYCGLTPGRRQSGSRDPQLRITKAGDSFLRRLLVQAAHYILGRFGPDSDLRRWGLAHAAAGGKNGKRRAVVAVARKLAVLLHRLWVSGEVYQPLRSDAGAA